MNRLWRNASALLGLLSGSGCVVATPDYGAPMPAYGVPDTAWYGTYELSGTTVDSLTGEAIPGIQVTLGGEVSRSDADGSWFLDPDYPCEADCALKAEDVDGPANGAYQGVERDYSTGAQFDSDVEIALELED